GTCTFLEKEYLLSDVRSQKVHDSVNFELCPRQIASWFHDDSVGNFASRYAPHIFEANAHILALTHLMLDEIAKGCPNGRIFAESLSITLISYVSGLYSEQQSTIKKQVRGKRYHFPRIKLQEIEEYMRENV